MALEVVLHPLAEDDIIQAREWYEARLSGLGDRFVAAVRLALRQAAQWPNAGAPVRHDDAGRPVERRVTTARFPYAIRYRVVDERLVVLAVYHQRRHPEFGSGR